MFEPALMPLPAWAGFAAGAMIAIVISARWLYKNTPRDDEGGITCR